MIFYFKPFLSYGDGYWNFHVIDGVQIFSALQRQQYQVSWYGQIGTHDEACASLHWQGSSFQAGKRGGLLLWLINKYYFCKLFLRSCVMLPVQSLSLSLFLSLKRDVSSQITTLCYVNKLHCYPQVIHQFIRVKWHRNVFFFLYTTNSQSSDWIALTGATLIIMGVSGRIADVHKQTVLYVYIYIYIFAWKRLPIPPQCAGACDEYSAK